MTPASISSFFFLLLSLSFLFFIHHQDQVFAYECTMKAPFNFTISARKMIDVPTTDHVHREDDLYCGYSFQKLFAILDSNATDHVMRASSASASRARHSIIIDNLRVTKYEFSGQRADVGARLVHKELYDQIDKNTKEKFTVPLLDEALAKQDTAIDVGRMDKTVVDVDASPEKPALFFLTYATSGGFFQCEYVVDSWNLASTREYVLTVEFSSNIPCDGSKVSDDESDEDF